MNKQALKEQKEHGSFDFPFHIISHTDNLGTYNVSFHWHDEIEIIYLEYGEINIRCTEKEYHLMPGDFYIINSNELHQISGKTPSLHHAIIFHPHFLDFSIFDKAEENFIHPITSGTAGFIPKIHQDRCYSHFLKRLVETSSKQYLSIKILLYALIDQLYQKDQITVEKYTETQENLKKIISYIQKNYNEPLTLNQIAQQIMITPNYLCKYFKKKMGITVFQYIQQYRINQSIDLLLQSDLPIINIAMQCGFDNLSYYIRTFKKQTGITPKQYRKRPKQQKISNKKELLSSL